MAHARAGALEPGYPAREPRVGFTNTARTTEPLLDSAEEVDDVVLRIAHVDESGHGPRLRLPLDDLPELAATGGGHFPHSRFQIVDFECELDQGVNPSRLAPLPQRSTTRGPARGRDVPGDAALPALPRHQGHPGHVLPQAGGLLRQDDHTVQRLDVERGKSLEITGQDLYLPESHEGDDRGTPTTRYSSGDALGARGPPGVVGAAARVRT